MFNGQYFLPIGTVFGFIAVLAAAALSHRVLGEFEQGGAHLFQLAVIFHLAHALALMFIGMRSQPQVSDPIAPAQAFTVQHAGPVKTYEGKILQAMYPQVENPKVTVEKNQETAKSRRVLQGTLDKGQVYVLWNL